MTFADTAAQRSSAELLHEAVCQPRANKPATVLDRLFAAMFRKLVYPQIWEDPRADMEALEITPHCRIVTIASGGCNALSYLCANPARIYAVDLNEAHVALVRLKLAAIQHLPNYPTFFRFFGNAQDWRNPRLYLDLIAPHLDQTSRDYWEGREWTGRRRITRFSRNFYRYGLLGRFIGSGHLTAKLLGFEPSRILSAETLDEQRRLFELNLAPMFDRPIVRWASAQPATLFGLGIPPAQFDALCDGGRRAMADVLRERCERLATGFDLKDNYFAWQAFARQYPQAGKGPCPPYLAKENYAAIRTRVDRVEVLKDNLIHFLSREPRESLDCFVLLDAQDWMDDETLTALWTQITRAARPGARVIFRTAGEKTILPGRVPTSILDQWTYDQRKSEAIHAKDRSAIYGGFHRYSKSP